MQTSESFMPRENDEACLKIVARMKRSEMRDSPTRGNDGPGFRFASSGLQLRPPYKRLQPQRTCATIRCHEEARQSDPS